MSSNVRIVRDAHEHWVGDGFRVKTVFSYSSLGVAISPFLLLDYAAPREFPPSETPHGVGEHPHRGFETVTIVYQGGVAHRDSGGNSGVIGPGDVQWMTAGSGLVHDEFHEREFAKHGGLVEMIQLWVNLPAQHKSHPPRYQTLTSSTIPTVELGSGAAARVIAGALSGARGPAKTFTPVDLWDLKFVRGATATLPLAAGRTCAVFVRHGALTIDGSETVRAGELALLDASRASVKLAATEDTGAMFLGGEPIREPIAGYGPFVMNTKSEIETAFKDYESGRMGHLDS